MQKTIFITGASRGFGKLWTEAFLKRGDKVAATARNLTALNELAATYGDHVLPLQLDVNNRTEVFAAVNKIEKHFGRIDVLINNAAYFMTVWKGPFWEMTVEEFDKAMAVNVRGSWLCAKAACARF